MTSSYELDQALPLVLAAIEPGQRIRAGFEAIEDVLLVAQRATTHPIGQSCDAAFPAVDMVEHDKALRAGPLDQQVALKSRAGRPRVPGRNGRGPADDDAGADGEMRIDGVAHCAGRIVEIDVDAPRTSRRERRPHVFGAVVDRRIVAEMIPAQRGLGGAAGDGDGATTLQIRDLPYCRSDRSRSGRDQHDVAALRLADEFEPDQRGNAVDAQNTQRQRTRQIGLAHPSDHRSWRDVCVSLPTEPSHHDVTRPKRGGAGFHDFADRQRPHGRAEIDRRGIVALVSDPAAHRRLNGQEIVADADTAVRQRRQVLFQDRKVSGLSDAGWARSENDPTIFHKRALIV